MPSDPAADARVISAKDLPDLPRLVGTVIVTVATAAFARYVLASYVGDRVPFLFSYPAIIAATLWGGWLAGVLTTLLCLIAAHVLIPPDMRLLLEPDMRGVVILYFATSALIVMMGEWARRARRTAEMLRATSAAAHKKALVAIAESDRRFRLMADSAPVLIWLADTTEARVWFNKPWLDFTGRSLEQEWGFGWAEGIHPEDRERCIDTYRQAFRARREYSMDYRLRRRDGVWRWVLSHGVPVYDNGTFTGYVGSCVDFTERKESESRLAESEQRFRALANSSPAMMWVNGLHGREFVNRAYAEYTGVAADEIVGTRSYGFIHPDDLGRYLTTYERAFEARKPFYGEVRVRRHDGVWRWVRSEALPRFADNGEFLGYVGMGLDITDMKLLLDERDQLLRAERAAREEAERNSQLKDEFLATVSHELRTPLNAMLGWAQIIRRTPGRHGTVEEGLEVIERNARMQAQLIEDLLDMSRIISGKVRLDTQRVELVPVIEAAIATVLPAAQAKGVRLRRVLDANAGPISGDASRLQQIFWNLLSNAVKFTPRGGSVEVLLERVNSHVEFTITDTGEGIAPDFLPHVFDRFRQADGSTTRRHGGLGLGLAIVRHLVEMHGGNVRAASAGVGQGASFVVTLPLRITESDVGDRTHPTSSGRPFDSTAFDCSDPKLTGVTVLVVDDEPDARTLVKHLLVECEAHVVEAANVDAALSLIEQKHPDVIVSDLGMPERDGIDLITALRDRGDLTPAVALTAFARAEDRLKAIQAGYQMHLAKPVEPTELVAVVASLAGRIGKHQVVEHEQT